MPFTPFHMGPALAVKAVPGHRFSLMDFDFSQVLMDLELLMLLVYFARGGAGDDRRA